MSVRSFLFRHPGIRNAMSLPLAGRRRVLALLGRNQQARLDSIQRLFADDVTVNVSEFEGKFKISPSSDIFRRILASGIYESELVQFYLKHINPCKDIIDVGANVGFYTVLGAKHLSSGRVLALEPTSGAYNRLLNNIEANGVTERVSAERCFVGPEGFISMNVVPGREEYSSAGALKHSAISGVKSMTEEVPCRPLDELVAAFGLRPALMKVDVEGAEGVVFRSAVSTLETHRPVVLSELNDSLLRAQGSSAAEVISLFRDLKYSVQDPLYPGIEPGTREYGDIICIPL